MAFTPLTSSQSLSFADNSYYRNADREADWGEPVYYAPGDWPSDTYGGYGGPHYQEGYNYSNSPETAKGNCTWWCCGRLRQTLNKSVSGLGNAKNWADNYSGTVDSNADNIQPGDIICLTDSDKGHVMFVEKVDGDTITISQSAWSTRSVWTDKACLVTTFDRGDLYAGNSINMYKDLDQTAAWEEVVGILRTGEAGPTPPTPPTPTETLTISITPSAYTSTMSGSDSYLDFTFDITISGIPAGETVSGGNTYPGLSRIYNTGWSYVSYVVDGITYQYAYKRQTLRYTRESSGTYSTTKYMYFNITKSTGTISTSTPMYITVQAKQNLIAVISRTLLRRRKKRGRYNVSIHL